MSIWPRIFKGRDCDGRLLSQMGCNELVLHFFGENYFVVEKSCGGGISRFRRFIWQKSTDVECGHPANNKSFPLLGIRGLGFSFLLRLVVVSLFFFTLIDESFKSLPLFRGIVFFRKKSDQAIKMAADQGHARKQTWHDVDVAEI